MNSKEEYKIKLAEEEVQKAFNRLYDERRRTHLINQQKENMKLMFIVFIAIVWGVSVIANSTPLAILSVFCSYIMFRGRSVL